MEDEAYKYQDKESNFSISTSAKMSYGTVKAQTDNSYDNMNAKGGSSSNAKSYAREVVENSRQSVRTRILKRKRKNIKIRDLETKKIGLDNRGGENFVGIYRHISEVYEAKLIKHKKHLFARLFLPNPAENYENFINSLSQDSQDSIQRKDIYFNKEGERTLLTFEELVDDGNYEWIQENWDSVAAEFGIEEPIPFPKDKCQIEYVELKKKETLVEHIDIISHQFTAPAGYIPYSVKATSVVTDDDNADNFALVIVLPSRVEFLVREEKTEFLFNFNEDKDDIHLDELDKLNFKLGFRIGQAFMVGIGCEITYIPLESTKKLWALNFYQSIIDKVKEAQNPLEELGIERKVNVLANVDAAQNLIKEELKRQSIQFVLGTDLTGFDCFPAPNPPSSVDYEYPQVDYDKTNALQPIVGFLNSIFDFEKMSHRFLPSYLGPEKNRTKLFDSSTSGIVREFVQAGWAEVILPVRRGEEFRLFYMLETGLVFTSSDEEAPLPNKRDYLALAEEILNDESKDDQEEMDSEGIIVDQWRFSLPTAFEILQEGGGLTATGNAVSNNSITRINEGT